MSINISPELESLLDEKVASGQFESREAIVETALRKLLNVQEASQSAEEASRERNWIGAPRQTDAELAAVVEHMNDSCKDNRLGDDVTLRELIDAGRKH